MPGMPRISGKPKKIAYKILGVPFNIASKKTTEQRYIDNRILAMNAYRLK